jgi:hypothetical protein
MGLRVFQPFRTLENKPMSGWNARAFKMLNCKTGRKIIEINQTNVESGELLPMISCIKERKESAHLTTG